MTNKEFAEKRIAEGIEYCLWCAKKRKIIKPIWEQERLKGGWAPLCTRCANRRLSNPYNALLNMRKIIK